MRPMINTFLVIGATSEARESAIAKQLADYSHSKTAVLIEGLANGKTVLTASADIVIARIASGCLCCSNNLIMRVNLNRLIQQQPKQLLISLATDTHLDKVKQFLTSSGYGQHLDLNGVIDLNLLSSEVTL